MRSPSSRPGPRKPAMLVRLALSKDALNTNGPAILRIASAIKCTWASLSMTHGPAIRPSAWPAPKAMVSPPGVRTSIPTRVLVDLFVIVAPILIAPAAVFIRRADEGAKQRMRLERFGFELRMELAAQEPRVIRNLADLNVGLIRRFAGNSQASGSKNFFVLAIELVAVPVALADLARTIGSLGETALFQHARPRASCRPVRRCLSIRAA